MNWQCRKLFVILALLVGCESHGLGSSRAPSSPATRLPAYTIEEAVELLERHRREQPANNPVQATTAFLESLDEHAVPHRTVVFYEIPQFGWYPLVELNLTDGDYLLDPYQGRTEVDPAGNPLPFPEALEVEGSVFEEFFGKPHMEWGAYAAVLTTHVGPAGFEFQSRNGNHTLYGCTTICYEPAYAYAGPATAPFGSHDLMHEFIFEETQPGDSLALSFTLAAGDIAAIILVTEGAELMEIDASESTSNFRFMSAATGSTIRLGAESQVTFENLRWTYP